MENKNKKAFTAYLQQCFSVAFFGSFHGALSFAPIVGAGFLWLYLEHTNLHIEFKGDDFGFISTIVYTIVAWIIIFICRLIFLAPWLTFKENTEEIERLNKSLDDKELRQIGMNRLWELRSEGIKLRNSEDVKSLTDFEGWEKKYQKWRNETHEAAGMVSQNLLRWIERLDQLQPMPCNLNFVNSEHQRLVHMMTEVLRRLEIYLTKDLVK